jgi:hypothetical protein
MSFYSHEKMAIIVLEKFVVHMVISGCAESCGKSFRAVQ